MKKGFVKKWLYLITAAMAVCCYAEPVSAQTDDLQDYIDQLQKKSKVKRNRAKATEESFTDVDLSRYSATERTTTLKVYGNLKLRFVNGTLKKSSSLEGPLLLVTENSVVEIGSSNSTSSTRATITSNGVVNGHEAIRLENGELRVTEGVVEGGYSNISSSYDDAVVMTSDNDKFVFGSDTKLSGWITNAIVCNASKASIELKSFSMHTGSADYGTIKTYSDIVTTGNAWLHVELLGKDNVVKFTSTLLPYWKTEITAPAKTYNDKIAEGSGYTLTEEDHKKVILNSTTKMGTYLQNNSIYIGIDDLQSWIDDLVHNGDDSNGKGTADDPYKGFIPCSGVDVDSDVTFGKDGDDLQWFIDGLAGNQQTDSGQATGEDDCQGVIRQNDGDITIPSGVTVNISHLHWHGCGCGHYIYVKGTLIIDVDIYIYYYLRFIHVLPGGHVIIRGLDGEVSNEVVYLEGGTVEYYGSETYGGKYGWYCPGGTIYIYNGVIKGGTAGGWTGQKGISYHYDGTVDGGIHNYGIHYWYGGICTGGGSYTIYNHKGGTFYFNGGTCGEGGTGKIWNEGDLYIDGGGKISCGDIFCVRGGCIYILKKLTFVIHLIFIEENIIPGETIISGGDGYKLTQDDVNRIQITLPKGYEWNFDKSCGCISIIKTTGISSIGSESSVVKESYEASGRKSTEVTKGLNIRRMENGEVKKVIVK